MSTPETDALDREQAWVRLVALSLSVLAGLATVVALGLELWLWAVGLAAFAVGASAWAIRMYGAQESRRAQQAAQNRAASAYSDPYEHKGLS
jgi:hypothetical protein